MPTELEEILLDLDLHRVVRELDKLRNHIQDSIPAEILMSESGQYNLRNRYGAILVHIASLNSILKTFLEK